MKRFLLLLLISANCLAATPNENKQIQELYRRGLEGDKAAVDQVINALEAMLQREPANQLARVYLGSAYTLRSRDLGIGAKKLQALRHGVALMDEAVAAAPEQPKVRLARALTNSALPGFLGRGSAARQDFVILAKEAERAPEKFEKNDLEIIRQHGANVRR